jgi:tripartite-type tricarboxylate transporter receptor subunit TctC
MKGKVIFGFIALWIVATVGGAYAAADYPVRPVILQVPWPPGGASDVMARILASVAEKKLGQPIMVINKAGAGSQVGVAETARAKPDGYYLGSISVPAFNTIILDPERKATFDLDSFVPIINNVVDPGLVWVKADSPYKTLKDLIDAAKKRPNEIRASTTGILGDDHLAILMMEEAAGVHFRIVHFDGGATQLTATMGGQVDVSFDNVGSVAPRVKAGQIRGLVVMDTERSKFLPDIPTTGELGYPHVISSSSRGLLGPRGIPDPIVKKLQVVFKAAMEDPGLIEKMDKATLPMKPMVGEEYGRFLRSIHEQAKVLMEVSRKAR